MLKKGDKCGVPCCTKQELDALVAKYETKEFIKDDPVQFPHRYSRKEDIEIAGFIASVMAFGFL